MAKKNIVKTLQGKPLNMDELVLRNEKTQPVGNLARGKKHQDHLMNDTVATGTRRPSRNGRRQIDNQVQDAPVMNSIKAARIIARKYLESEGDVPAQRTIVAPAPAPAAPKPTAPAPKPVARTITPPPATVKPQPPKAEAAPVEPPKPVDEVSDEVLDKVIEEVNKPKGLAAAIAKAREVKQEPLKTPREEARGVDGVKKI